MNAGQQTDWGTQRMFDMHNYFIASNTANSKNDLSIRIGKIIA